MQKHIYSLAVANKNSCDKPRKQYVLIANNNKNSLNK